MSKVPDIDAKLDVNIDADIDADIDTSDINVGLTLDGKQDINLAAEIKVPDPIQTRAELAITEPIVTAVNADVTMDVRPVVVDLCLTLSVGKLPRTCIRRQYDRHMGLTLFGIEVLGFNRAGESQFVLDELVPRSHVELGGKAGHRGHQPGHSKRSGRSAGMRATDGGGLAIRLDG